jgi:hypothetical protein
MDERSSQKWPAKVLSSMASLHKNGFASTIHHHFPDLNLPFMASRTSGLYRLEVGNKLPTSPQDLASKRAQDPPKMD